jgi:mRNA-degrading endonuclease RelE of RelBE toxin-antitoxin system
MNWGLILSNQASRTVRRAPWNEREQIKAALRLLSDDPYFGDVKPLKGTNGTLRRRVGNWRILYSLDTDRRMIVVTAVKRRGSNTY